MTHSAQTRMPTTNRAIVFRPPQPHTVVWAIAISTSEIPTVISAAASQFILPGERTGDSGMNRQVAIAASTVTTSGSQNSQCQLRCWTIRPPMIRPAPPPTPRIDDISPMLPATCSLGNSSRMIENAKGKIPPATPWITRATISTPSELETAASSVPNARITSVHSEQSLLAVHVAEPADDRRPDRGRQQEAGEQPGDARLAGVEVLLNRRQGRDHGRAQDRVGQPGQRQDGQDHIRVDPLRPMTETCPPAALASG